MKTLKRCANSNPVLIDLETYNINNVIDIDVPEKHKKQRGVKEKSPLSKTVYIYIDDDESPIDHHAGQNARNSEKGASSSRRYVSDISPLKISKGKRTYSGIRFSAPSDIELSDDDSPDCEYIEDPSPEIREQWERASLKRKRELHNDHNDIKVDKSKHKRSQDTNFNGTRHEKRGESSARKGDLHNDRNDIGVDKNSHKKNNGTPHEKRGESSAWKGDLHNDRNDIGVDKNKHKHSQDANFNGTCHEKRGESSARKDVEQNLSDHDLRDNIDLDGGLDINKQTNSHDSRHMFNRTQNAEKRKSSAPSDNLTDYGAKNTVDDGKDDLPVCEAPVGHVDVAETDGQVPSTSNAEENEMNDLKNDATVVDNPNSIISEREKHKETDEYKRALKEELTERQRALKIQAEEAQHLRLMLKRKRAQSLRILDTERRQRQRVDEIRESQKKEEENMNLKEQYRCEVMQGLKMLEITCFDMASLLRGLGIEVGGGPVPLPDEVRAAYKRATLTFHPDRWSSNGDMRQKVEAEEKFKLISRMKGKLSL